MIRNKTARSGRAVFFTEMTSTIMEAVLGDSTPALQTWMEHLHA